MNAAALMRRGAESFGRGDYGVALDCFGQVLQGNPHDAYALSNRAAVLSQLGCFDEALQDLGQVPAGAPCYLDAQCNRAYVLHRLRRATEALACADGVLAVRPGDFAALSNRAYILLDLGRREAAAQCLAQAVVQRPGHAESLFLLGRTLVELEHSKEALPPLQRALALQPDHAGALNAHGFALIQLHQPEQALHSLDRLLQLQPGMVEAQINRGVALLALERCAEALEVFDRVLTLAPRNVAAHENRGVSLERLNRRVEALAALNAALELDPQCASSRHNRSVIHLALGRLEEGFLDMESRWEGSSLKAQRPSFAAPLWLGDAPLEGRRILLHSEQGFGDSLQFVRYAPMVAALGAEVILFAPLHLRRLFSSLKGSIALPVDGEPLPPFDFHCPLMSLPLAFRTRLESIPAPVPYLGADATLAERWNRALGPRDRPRIGLLWAGRQYPPINTKRDMPLHSLLALLELPVHWICLQKEVPAADLPLLQSLPVLQRHGEMLGDFADTAALIENLDLVIAVDSAVAHLAGALGKPVWIMNRHAACWRWLERRSDSPWYPSARLFRQPALGQWDAVAAEVAQALRGFIATQAARESVAA
ncbi:MAG: glycosyltransferase 9 family protein [Nevskia sp.]|nr:glycosyltransferase 9 family protein [Nevskia sp.]